MDLSHLNPQQRQAVTSTKGPILVLAGAGSGKTKVIIQRIAWLIQVEQVLPAEILAVTFTNKAANEMKKRVESILKISTAGWWIGTFHSMGARILRKNPEIVGLKKQFTIIDIDDQLKLLKQVLSFHDIHYRVWKLIWHHFHQDHLSIFA